jgi:hypothetical protein
VHTLVDAYTANIRFDSSKAKRHVWSILSRWKNFAGDLLLMAESMRFSLSRKIMMFP